MADNSESNNGATSGAGETPEFVSKAELNATINGFRKSLQADLKKELAELKAAFQPNTEDAPPVSKKASKEVDPEKKK